MTRYRLLALDLDGTLLTGRDEVSPANAEWIRRAREAGVVVILSTGRGLAGALPIAERLDLDTPMVTVNGGEIWRKPGELHRRTLLDAAMVTRLHRLTRSFPDAWYWAYSTEGIWNKENWADDAASRQWLKFGFYIEDLDVIQAIRSEIRTWEGLEISNSSPFNIEINPAGVSKGAALEEVCRLIGCSMAEAVAIGDSLNDIAAIRACGLGVAMGNAQDEVKAAANAVTARCEEDGVAQAIREYVLKA